MLRSMGCQTLCATFAFAAAGSAEGSAVTGTVGATPDQIVLVQPAYEPQETYGAAATVLTVRIEDFTPPNTNISWATVNTGGVYIFQDSTTQTDWWGKVYLPNGAIVDRLEMQACDNTGLGNIFFGMSRMDAPGQGGGNVTPIGTTGTAAVPGCAFFSLVPSPALTINNQNNSYLISVSWSGTFNNTNKVAAFRVYYRLQVSPAPATATFPNDVPTSHPLFRFVEAMAASGLTGGCAPGSFCPDSPLTRGQMAVFLSVALGLHFPN